MHGTMNIKLFVWSQRPCRADFIGWSWMTVVKENAVWWELGGRPFGNTACCWRIGQRVAKYIGSSCLLA